MGEKFLAGLGLGTLTCGILLQSISSSFSQVVASLVAPAFGDGDLRFCKVLLNRQLLLNIIVYAIISTPVLFLKQIYGMIGQDPVISEVAVRYVQYVYPGLFFYMQS